MGSGTCYRNMAECVYLHILLHYLLGVGELWKALAGQGADMAEECSNTICSFLIGLSDEGVLEVESWTGEQLRAREVLEKRECRGRESGGIGTNLHWKVRQ